MEEELIKELQFLTSRASGPGGQHVNKTDSRVTLVWNLERSTAVSPEQKQRLREALQSRLNTKGELQMSSQASRSQRVNKETVIRRFLELVRRLSLPPRKRIPTRATRASKERRLQQKKARSDVKKMRRRPPGA